MKTAVQIFLKQTRRSTKRLVLQLVLLCAATAFFVVSLNLYQNSRLNLLAVENAYTTLAAVSFYGDVDSHGNLVSVSDEAYVGNWQTTVRKEQLDSSQLLSLKEVIGYDLRPRFAAYIPGAERLLSSNEDHLLEVADWYDVIRFVIDGDEPVAIRLVGKPTVGYFNIITEVDINLISTARTLTYPAGLRFSFLPSRDNAYSGLEEKMAFYADEIRAINQSDDIDNIILYPGVEYVMHFYTNAFFQWDPAAEKYIFHSNIGSTSSAYVDVVLTENQYDKTNQGFVYLRGGESLQLSSREEDNQPLFIQRWEDVKKDPEQLAYWNAVSQTAAYSGQAFYVTLTNDMESIPAWYAGGMYLHEGRMITEEEYASGARVCMVSAQTAALQRWKVGDTLDLHLYEDQLYLNRVGMEPLYYDATYRKANNGFFDQGTYTIVGIFGQREIKDMGENLPEVYYQPWDTIYAPTNSVQNKPEESTWLIQPSTLSLQLKNGSISEFKAAVEELGLTEQKTGQYQLKFSYFDQGYEKIKPGLDEMYKNAKLLLGLSAALLAVTMVLTAFLFAQQHKHSAGILRMLGGSKKQAFTAILACAAAVVAAGGVIGTILGGVLTQSVGASTLGDAAEGAKVALSTGASPLLTILSGAACIVLFLLLTAAFTATYIGKEPRALLPQDKV